MINKKNLLINLDKNKCKYKLYEHSALFSVEDSVKNRGSIEGSHSKNLFLKNKKNQFYLFSCLEDTHIDLKKLSKILNLGNISFAKEGYLRDILGVTPGSVTPFGLLNDIQNKVIFYLDSGFFKKKIVNFHPLENTSTISMQINDFIKYMEKNKKINIFNFTDYTLLDDIKYNYE
jgi:Ala-tRNA(Pro) deacylase